MEYCNIGVLSQREAFDTVIYCSIIPRPDVPFGTGGQYSIIPDFVKIEHSYTN
jgi:hypothetical protein